MSVEIVMPRLSDTMDTGTIARWNKQVGDRVKRGEVLLEIETDKANMDLESYADGILAKIMVREGESAPVGAPIGIVAENEEELQRLQEPVSAGSSQPPAATAAETGQSSPVREAQGTAPRLQVAEAPSERIKTSPLARRIAEEHNVDLRSVKGTGPAGRITREDVEAYLKQVHVPAKEAASAEVAREAPPPPAPAIVAPTGAEEELVPMTRLQQTVARRMAESMFSAPHFYVTVEIDMTEARALLSQIERAASEEVHIGPNDIILKACALALRRFPNVNASYRDGQIVHHRAIHIGNAVARPGALLVPVIRDADKKSLRAIAAESKDLIARAREGKLKQHELEGSTFTISNLGMYGVEQFTAIINPPEGAILAVGTIQPKPVVVNGEIVVRDRMRVTLSVDHRVIYGADAAEFLAEVRRLLENPLQILL
jgi:pyruvate dehydrogenase E2 component (dihydrolipoamide acetyltransferase)